MPPCVILRLDFRQGWLEQFLQPLRYHRCFPRQAWEAPCEWEAEGSVKRDQVLGTVVIVNNPFPCGLCQPVPAALGCAQEGEEVLGLLRRRFLAPHNDTAGNTTTCLMTLLCLSFLISELGFVLRSASGNQVNGD